MNWIELTADALKAQMSEPEWAALAEASRASTESDPLTTAVTRVAQRVRGYVESNPQNTLGPDGYVPAVLYDGALALLLETLAATLPASGLIMDDTRRKRCETAVQELRDVAKGILRVSYGSGQAAGTDAPTQDTGDYGGDDPVSWSGVR